MAWRKSRRQTQPSRSGSASRCHSCVSSSPLLEGQHSPGKSDSHRSHCFLFRGSEELAGYAPRKTSSFQHHIKISHLLSRIASLLLCFPGKETQPATKPSHDSSRIRGARSPHLRVLRPVSARRAPFPPTPSAENIPYAKVPHLGTENHARAYFPVMSYFRGNRVTFRIMQKKCAMGGKRQYLYL